MLLGVNGSVEEYAVRVVHPVLNNGTDFATGEMQCVRGEWKSRCVSEIRRNLEEHQWRRRLSNTELTRRSVSVGSNQD